jgi:hypothetical protein
MDDPILEQIEALLEAARREAYERGYADAISRVMKAAAELPGAVGEPAPAPPVRQQREVLEAAPGMNGGGRQRAPRGSIERRVVTLLEAAPTGLTVPEIEALASSGEEPLKTPSIRVALQRLLAQGQVVREGRRWAVAAEAAMPAQAEAVKVETEAQAAVADAEEETAY